MGKNGVRYIRPAYPLHPTGARQERRYLVERGNRRGRRVARQRLPTRAAIDPNGAEAQLAGGGEVEMGTRADMYELLRRDAEGVPGMGENSRGRLVSERLLRRDDAIDMPSELCDVAGDDGIVRVGDYGQMEACRAAEPTWRR